MVAPDKFTANNGGAKGPGSTPDAPRSAQGVSSRDAYADVQDAGRGGTVLNRLFCTSYDSERRDFVITETPDPLRIMRAALYALAERCEQEGDIYARDLAVEALQAAGVWK